MVRVHFAGYGEPSHGQPSLYSVNDPKGMCPACAGLGHAQRVDPDLMLDKTMSLDEGAILVPGYPVGSPGWQFYANHPGSIPQRNRPSTPRRSCTRCSTAGQGRWSSPSPTARPTG